MGEDLAIVARQDFLEERQNVFGVVDNQNSGCHKTPTFDHSQQSILPIQRNDDLFPYFALKVFLKIPSFHVLFIRSQTAL